MTRQPNETAFRTSRQTKRDRSQTSTAERTTHADGTHDDIAGRHGLHHDQSIDTEHEPFSVVSQRCRGGYP